MKLGTFLRMHLIGGCLTYVAPESNLVLLNQAPNLLTGHRR